MAPTFHQLHGENLRASPNSRIAARKKDFDRGLSALFTSLSKNFSTPTSTSGADATSLPRILLLVKKNDGGVSGVADSDRCFRPSPFSETAPISQTVPWVFEKGWAFMQVQENSEAMGTLVAVSCRGGDEWRARARRPRDTRLPRHQAATLVQFLRVRIRHAAQV